MAKVILEIIQRGVSQYHKLENYPVTIGRAFDNDIILQDVTVSPHHLVIHEEEGQVTIQNISNENGTKINGKKIDNSPQAISLPTDLFISNIKARLLSSDMPVEKTYVQDCTGLFCFFNSPVWAAVLLLSTIGLFFLERYLITPVEKDFFYYLSMVLPSIWTMLGIAVVITGLSRLSTHRWEIIPSITIASLVFLVPQVFDYLGHYVSYLFTSDSMGSWVKNTARFLVIPTLLAAFMVKTIHSKWLPALGVAVLVYSPFLAYQLLGVVDKLSLTSDFTQTPIYSETLLPGDNRLNATLSLNQFTNEAEKTLEEDVKKMLEDAKEKEAKS